MIPRLLVSVNPDTIFDFCRVSSVLIICMVLSAPFPSFTVATATVLKLCPPPRLLPAAVFPGTLSAPLTLHHLGHHTVRLSLSIVANASLLLPLRIHIRLGPAVVVTGSRNDWYHCRCCLQRGQLLSEQYTCINSRHSTHNATSSYRV